MYCPTLGACPLANGERQTFDNMPAVVAPFAGWEEAIHLGERLPVAVALVLQESRELAHRSVTESAGETVVLDHTAHVQVFDADRVEPANDVGGDLVHVVETRVGDLRLNAGDLDTLAISSVTSFLASREHALCLGEFTGLFLGQTRVDDVFAVGQGGEPVDTEIDADGLAGLRQGGNWFIENQRDEVPSIAALGYRRSSGSTREGSRPVDIEETEFGDSQVAVGSVILEGAQRVLCGLWTVLFLEGRVAGALAEEVPERGLKMPKRLLRRDAGDLVEPCSSLLLLQLREGGRRGVVVYVLSDVVSIGASAECPVVDETTGSEGPRQHALLRRSWVEPESVTDFHNINRTRVKDASQERIDASPVV